MFLKAALRPSLLDDILQRDPLPASYNDWKSTTLKCDHNQCNSALTRSFHSTSSFNNNRRPFPTLLFKPRQFLSTPSNPTTTPSSTTLNVPTTQPLANTQNNKDSNTVSKQKVCWKCGEPGHFARECLKKSSNSKVRALYEQFEELDSALKIASSGAETIRNLLDSEDEIIDDDCRLVLERFLTDNPFFVGHDE